MDSFDFKGCVLMCNLLKHGSRGSFTVEASIIFSTIFFCLIALIYLCLLLYQQAYIQSLAGTAVERGVLIWNNPTRDINTGKVSKRDLSNGGLYWRLWDTNHNQKIEKVRDYIKSNLKTYALLGNSSAKSQVKVELTNYIIYKKLTVEILYYQDLPLGNFLKIFGLKKSFPVHVVAEAVINEPVEFIRNTDFAIDLGNEVTGGKISEVGPKITDIINSMQNKLKNFVDKEQ